MTINSALLAAAMSCTILTAGNLSAQATDSLLASTPKARWEILLPGGTLVPTGAQHDAIKRGNLTALQVSFVARPAFAITSTVGWARSQDISIAGNPKLDVFTYDVGAEARAPQWMTAKAVTFTPFAGVGAGGRSYNYRKLDVDATHNVAAYGSVGGEFGVRRVRVRLEARDYVTGFKPLSGAGAARTGNDVVVMAGLRFAAR
ncbi:MAG TPA: hypothetical protein VK636_22360 [Gemmatimonadaceae bacterium]|nr:hypothetical protein [Gemmatimonadaceae bacterium]